MLQVETPGGGDPAESCSPLGSYREGMEFNPVEKVIYDRRSIRAFKKTPVPDGLIRRVLEAGRFAPSAGNSQPWKFVVVRSPEIIAAMEHDAMRVCRTFRWVLDYTGSWFRRTFVVHLTRLLTRIFPTELHPVPFAALLQMGRGDLAMFYEAPVLIILLKDRRGVADTSLGVGIAGQNMVLAAQSLGLGTCWIGFIRLLTWSRNWLKWKRRFGIRYPYEMVECIAIGYPRKREHRMVPREVQLVAWLEGALDQEPRIERQGE